MWNKSPLLAFGLIMHRMWYQRFDHRRRKKVSTHNRPYIFLELTNSICAVCLKKVEAKLVLQDAHVYMLKNCLTHGREKVLISTDFEYYKLSRGFLKPGQIPLRFNTETKFGCP